MISGFHFCCAPSLLVVDNDTLVNEPDKGWQIAKNSAGIAKKARNRDTCTVCIYQ